MLEFSGNSLLKSFKMATINNRFVHFKYKSDFDKRYAETTDNGQTYGDILGKSIVFIKDANKI